LLPQGTEVEAGTLLDVAGAVPASVTARLLDACRSDAFAKVQAAVVDTIADGWGVRVATWARATCAVGLAGVASASADGLLWLMRSTSCLSLSDQSCTSVLKGWHCRQCRKTAWKKQALIPITQGPESAFFACIA